MTTDINDPNLLFYTKEETKQMISDAVSRSFRKAHPKMAFCFYIVKAVILLGLIALLSQCSCECIWKP